MFLIFRCQKDKAFCSFKIIFLQNPSCLWAADVESVECKNGWPVTKFHLENHCNLFTCTAHFPMVKRNGCKWTRMNISEGLSTYRVSRRNTGVHDKTVGVSMQNPDTGMACQTGLQYWLEYRAGERSCLIMFCNKKAFLNQGTSGDKRHLLAPRIFTRWVKNWSLYPGIEVFMCWEFKVYRLP